MPSRRERAINAVIKVARRLIANTPVQRLPIVTAIYRRVFRLGYPAAEVTTGFRDVRLTVPTGDNTIVPGLVGGFYEKIELDVFERLTRSSQRVVDVGANVGLYTCLAATWLPPDGRVTAFEPVPANLQYLHQNVGQNTLSDRVVIEEMAVGDGPGVIDIYLVEGSIGTHSASARNALDSTRSVTVAVVSLDQYLADRSGPRTDILKVDVEGYEGHVLRGARTLLRNDGPTLLVEFMAHHLTNCGFAPDDFLDLVFESYDRVYVVDEPRAVVKPCDKAELLRLGGYKNINLIAVSQRSHPEHVDVLEAFCSGGRGVEARAT